jgi:syntaxin 6
VEAGKGSTHASINGMHRELMRLPDSHQSTSKSNQYSAGDNDDFIESESDRQMLLIKYLFFSSSLLHVALNYFPFPTLN